MTNPLDELEKLLRTYVQAKAKSDESDETPLDELTPDQVAAAERTIEARRALFVRMLKAAPALLAIARAAVELRRAPGHLRVEKVLHEAVDKLMAGGAP